MHLQSNQIGVSRYFPSRNEVREMIYVQYTETSRIATDFVFFYDKMKAFTAAAFVSGWNVVLQVENELKLF